MAAPISLCGSLSRFASVLGRSMHEAGYRALELPFTYVPFEVRELGDAIAGMRGLGIRGLGVSHPFKQDVLPLLDELDPVAERIGAVNTVVNEDGRLVGHNTDWMGAIRALEEVSSVAGARVLLSAPGGPDARSPSVCATEARMSRLRIEVPLRRRLLPRRPALAPRHGTNAFGPPTTRR